MNNSLVDGQHVVHGLQTFEYIMPFPYCSNIELTDGRITPQLSLLSTVAVDAAVQAYRHNLDARIIIAGETLFEDLPNTTTLMAERALSLGVPASSIIPIYRLQNGEGLNNTYLQTQAVRELLHGPIEHTLVIALGHHMRRARRAMHSFNLHPSYAVAEDILHASGIAVYDKYLPLLAKLNRSELFARIITDGVGLPHGEIPTCIMQFTGPRIIDIVEEPDGELRLENTLAHAKRQALAAKQHARAA